jgi:hypothetical protein
MSTNTDPLDGALRSAAPLGQVSLDTSEVHDAISAMLAQTRVSAGSGRQDDGAVADLLPFASVDGAGRPRAGATGQPRRRRKTAIRTVVATSVILAAGTGVAAAAGLIDMHTGVFGKPGMTENDTSEYLNSAGAQVPELMRSYVEEMPLAPGYDADPLIERFTSGGHGMVQAAGLRGQVFAWSSCSWELAWLDANAAGDTAAQAEATAVLTQIPGWPTVPVVDGDGSVTATVREIAEAASAGDPGPIQQDTAVNCDSMFAR